MKILFICSRNKDRSPTAEDMYKGLPDIQVKSAGVDPDAINIVTKEMVEWSDIIVVMDGIHDRQLFKLHQKFPFLKPMNKKIVDFGIPDQFVRGEPRLVELISSKMKEHFGL